jgi:hypothetical protein
LTADSTIADTLVKTGVIIHHVYHSVRDPVMVNLPAEKWWQSNLASAIAGGLIVILAQFVGNTVTAWRHKKRVRRRLVDEMVVLIVHCGSAARDIGKHLHAAGAALEPIRSGRAAFAQARQDLSLFRDRTVSWRMQGWYADVGEAEAMGREQIGHALFAAQNREQLVPEAYDAMGNVAVYFRRLEIRGKRIVEFVLRADRFAWRPRVRRLRRALRRLRYSAFPRR